MNTETVLGFVAVILIVLYIVDKWNNNRTVDTLTNAVKDKASDEQLVKLAHSMAVNVISVDAMAQILSAVKAGGEFVKILAPDEIDALVNAGLDLAGAIASGQPITIKDVVKAIEVKAALASG